MTARRHIVSIAAAFIAVAVAFVAASAFTNRQLEEIDTDARRLASTTLPAVERITLVRSDLRELDAVLEEHVALVASGARPSGDSVRRVLARAQADAEACRRGQTSTDARATMEDLRVQLAAAAEATLHALEVTRASEDDTLRMEIARSITPAVSRADADLRALMEGEIGRAESLARAMAAVRRRATRLAFLLDALCVGLAGAASVVVARAVSRYSRLLEQHGRFLERRAVELEEFSGRVAHDVLSPLTAVSFAIAHAERMHQDETVRKSLARGRSSLDRVRVIVDALFDFARSGARPRPGATADMREVIVDALTDVAPLAETKNVTVVATPHARLDVACDKGILTSIVVNLLRNAVKYMGDGDERRVTVRVAAHGARVRCEVEDTGIGMSRAIAGRVFEPYVRAPNSSEPGIGLGLATVKRLVTAHGGALGVESTPGRGSTFWFELPRA